MKKLFIFLLCLCWAAAFAQDCDSEQLKTVPGKWLPQPGDEVLTNTTRPTAAEAAGAKSVFNRIGKMFQQEYKPVGVDAYNYLTHAIDPGSASGNAYIYTVSNFRFLCINGKRTKNSEGISSSVAINPGWLSGIKLSEMPVYDEYGKVNSETASSCGFYTLSPKECKGGKLPDLSNGYHSLESGYDYYVWITREGKLPYRYVTRKEFLEKQVTIGEANLKELHQRYSSKSWKEQLEMFPELKEKMLEGQKSSLSMYEDPLRAYRKELEKDAAWLNEMAVVKSDALRDPATNKYLYSRYSFTTVDDHSMVVPIMPNPAYYDPKLPKWAPQFIVIDVGRIDGFIGENIRKVVDENIDFFKSLL